MQDDDFEYDPSMDMPGDPFEDMDQAGRGDRW